MTDVNVFVCRSRHRAEREALGLTLMRQQVAHGKLKAAWMSDEEKAAYRLREPQEARADLRGFDCQGRSKSGPLAPVEKWTTLEVRTGLGRYAGWGEAGCPRSEGA